MTSRMVGPKLKRRVCQSGADAFGSLALMTTLCCCSAASRSSVANAGRCVWNFFELVPLGSLTGSFVVPVIESAVEVMLTTLPWFTWSRNELYEIVTVGAWNADVTTFAHRLAAFFDDPVEVGQNALMASGAYPEYTAAVLEHYETMFDAWRDRVARARERGELAEGVDADAVLLTLASPLLLVPLLFRRPISRGEVSRVVALVLRATTRDDH